MRCGKPDAGRTGWAEREKDYLCPTARKLFSNRHFSSINRQSSSINPNGFTLIELLVVIALIGLLMSILFPALQAGKKRGQAVKCQAILHQWGLYYATYTSENNYKIPSSLDGGIRSGVPGVLPRDFFKDPHIHEDDAGRPYVAGYARMLKGKGLFLCPATRFQPPDSGLYWSSNGTTWLAWSYPVTMWAAESFGLSGSSYTQNSWISWKNAGNAPRIFTSCLVKAAGAVPVYSDCRTVNTLPGTGDPPPPYEDASPGVMSSLAFYVMNRHNGGINSLFMDWSVRKVGAKELWTLKWGPYYETGGPWTKRGAVKPEDWPAWMRGFKDY